MKEIIKNYYSIAFGLTGVKSTSYYFALLVVAALSLTSLSGISLLLQEIAPTKPILVAFKFPYHLAVGAILFLLLYMLYPSSKIAYKNPNKATNYGLIILSLAIAGTLYGYSFFARIPNL
jgi:hypothetical protein